MGQFLGKLKIFLFFDPFLQRWAHVTHKTCTTLPHTDPQKHTPTYLQTHTSRDPHTHRHIPPQNHRHINLPPPEISLVFFTSVNFLRPPPSKNKTSQIFMKIHTLVYIISPMRGIRSKFDFGHQGAPLPLVFGTFGHFFGFFLVLSFLYAK